MSGLRILIALVCAVMLAVVLAPRLIAPTSMAAGTGSVVPASTATPSPVAAPAPAVPSTVADAVAVSAPVEKRNVVKYGDLTTMEYTATEDLHASLVSPAANGFVSTLASKVVVETIRGAGVELAVNGQVVSLKQLGAREVDEDTGDTRYAYFGIKFKPGPNDVSLVPIGAGGLRGDIISTVIYGPGSPARIEAHLLGTLRADGKSPGILRVTALDRWNHPAAAGSVMKISVLQGDAKLLPPIDLSKVAAKVAEPAPGVTAAPVVTALNGAAQSFDTALPDGGVVDLPILPGLTAGDVFVHFQSGEISEDTSFFVRPYLRAPLVAGVVHLGIGVVPGDHDGDGQPDAGGSRKQRAAIFGTGAIGKSTAATFAYETANRLSRSTTLGSFAANPEIRPYQTYGDSSAHRVDALSDGRFFARLENGHDSLSYGQFMATVGGNDSVGQYSQLMSGMSLDGSAVQGRLRFGAFTAKNAIAYAKDVFDPSGLGTLGRLLKPDIIVGSDIVSIATLDRRTGAIVAQTVLERGVDYSIDYLSGMLRFVTIPLPFDVNFNPQVVSVRYEYTGTNINAQTAGGRLAVKVGKRGQTTLSLGYVNDVSGTSSYSLFQQDASGRFNGGTWSLSHANAAGVVPGTDTLAGIVSGGALRGTLNWQGAADRVALSYDDTAAGFANPFGGLSSPGLRNIRAGYARKFGAAGDLALQYSGQQNHGFNVASTLSTLSLQMHRRFGKRLQMTVGIDERRQSSATSVSVFQPSTPGLVGTVDSNSATTTVQPVMTPAQQDTQVTLGVDYAVSAQTSLSLTHSASLGGSSTSSSPAQSAISLSTTMGKYGRAYVRELWSSAAPVPFAASTSSLAVAGTATRQTTFGFDRTLGKNTALTSEYTLEHVGDGTLIFSTLGVREKITFGKQLSGDAFVQTGNTAGGAASLGGQTAPSGFGLYGFSFAYVNGAASRFTGSFQDRTGSFGGANGSLAMAAQITPSISMLGSVQMSNQGAFRSQEMKLGSSWRPVNDDRGSGLLEVERRSGSALSQTAGAISDIASYEQVYRPTSRLDLSGRIAYKLDGDGIYAAHSALLDFRADQRIGSRLDVGAESRTLLVAGLPKATQTALGVEAGYRVGPSLRLAGGYYFSAAADPSLNTAPPRKGFYATMTMVIDRLFGWGKKQ